MVHAEVIHHYIGEVFPALFLQVFDEVKERVGVLAALENMGERRRP